MVVRLDVPAEGVVEGAGALVGVDDDQVSADLDRFTDCIEFRGSAGGAWGGDVAPASHWNRALRAAGLPAST